MYLFYIADIMLACRIASRRHVHCLRCLTTPLLRSNRVVVAPALCRRHEQLFATTHTLLVPVTQHDSLPAGSVSASLSDAMFPVHNQLSEKVDALINEKRDRKPQVRLSQHVTSAHAISNFALRSKVKIRNLDNNTATTNHSNHTLRNDGPGMLSVSSLQSSYNKVYCKQTYLKPQTLLSKERNKLCIPNENLGSQLLEVTQELYPLIVHNRGSNTFSNIRFYHTTPILLDSTPSSQVEVTVNALKEKAEASKQEKEKQEADSKISKSLSADVAAGPDIAARATTNYATLTTDALVEAKTATVAAGSADPSSTTTVAKKSIWTRVQEEVLHYYHGFRLLFIDTKICVKYCYRVAKGEKLSRREHRQVSCCYERLSVVEKRVLLTIYSTQSFLRGL